jgi:hypothetical protein
VSKEAAWVLSNVAAGSAAHIDAVVSAGILPVALTRIIGAPFDLKREVRRTCLARLAGLTAPQLAYLLVNVGRDPRYTDPVATAPGVLPELVRLLLSPDPELAVACLEFVRLILERIRNVPWPEPYLSVCVF